MITDANDTDDAGQGWAMRHDTHRRGIPLWVPTNVSQTSIGQPQGITPTSKTFRSPFWVLLLYPPLRGTPSINRGRASGGQLSTVLEVPVGRTFCSGSFTGYQQQFIYFFRSKPGRNSNNIGKESHSFHIPPIPKDWCPDKNEQQKRGATAWPPLLGFIHSPGMEITLPELSYPG